MSERRFVAAALQMSSGNDLAANLAICWRRAAEAARAGVRLLVLPENFAFLGERERDKMAIAEPIAKPQRKKTVRNEPAESGEPECSEATERFTAAVGMAGAVTADTPGMITRALIEMAKDHHLWIIAGGMPEIPREAIGKDRADIARTHNACLAISPEGEIAAVYRKIHLFDVDIPGGAVLRESDSTAPGNEIVSVETPFARIGLSVCYDLRFPELYRDLAIKHRAEILVVPAAFTAYTGAAHWHVLLRSRAIENQCYVIAAAQYGVHNPKRESYGHSLIIDPWGKVVAELPDGEGLIMAELDLDVLDETRRRMPCLDHQLLVR